MPNAIHKTVAGDTLADISRQYYALEGPQGVVRDVELTKVTNAIRNATPLLLDDFKDIDELPPSTTLFVPTLRELNRVVFSDHPALLASLKKHGFDHARKLLRYPSDQVVEYLSPLPSDYTADDIKRVCTVTALFNLDGMDRYTAKYLYDTEEITSMQELAGQSPATIDSVLQTLITPPLSRPQELTTQDHAKRWILSAKIQVRKKIGELTKIKGRFFQVPFKPSTATRQAEFYDACSWLPSLARRVFQYLITGRFELLPLRTLAHTHVRLIDILLVEKEINRSQRLAKYVVSVVMRL